MAYCTNCLHKATELYTLWPGSYTVTPLGYSPRTERKKLGGGRRLAWTADTDEHDNHRHCSFRSDRCRQWDQMNKAEKRLANRASLLDIPWTDVLFPRVLARLTFIELFRLRRVSSESLFMISEYFKSLTEINANNVDLNENQNRPPINDNERKLSREAFSVLTVDVTQLKKLNLANCKWLTNEQLVSIVEQNPCLEQLDISGCREINNTGLITVADHCRNLKCLRLKECHWLSSATVSVLAEKCCELEQVDVTSCWEVGDDAAIDLISRCRQLKVISLSKIYGITDRTALALAVHAKHLVELNVSGCWRLTDYGIRMVGEYCTRLKQITVGDCRDVTEEGLTALRTRGIRVVIPDDTRRPRPFLRGLELRLQV